MENKKVKSKTKSARKIMNTKNKTCKKFCKKIFLPERERVEIEFSNKYNKKNKYQSIKVLRKTNKSLAKLLENMYLNGCNDIYCQKSCKNSKNKWLNSFTKKRKENLIQQGAISGCRDLIKEFPEYYKNI
jgi:hypothetical protein